MKIKNLDLAENNGMKDEGVPIYFYVPSEVLPSVLPPDMAKITNEAWSEIWAKDPQTCNCNWILQTYLRLQRGFSCQLMTTLPDQGVVLAFRGSLPFWYKPTQQQLLVCIAADAGSHPFAQLHIVQNPKQTALIQDSFFMPHWIQPGLIARDQYLKTSPNLQKAMVENAHKRATETNPERITDRWISFLVEIALPTWQRWCKTSPWQQQLFFCSRYLELRRNGLKQRIIAAQSNFVKEVS